MCNSSPTYLTRLLLLLPPVLIPSLSTLISSLVPEPPSDTNSVSPSEHVSPLVIHFFSAVSFLFETTPMLIGVAPEGRPVTVT